MPITTITNPIPITFTIVHHYYYPHYHLIGIYCCQRLLIRFQVTSLSSKHSTQTSELTQIYLIVAP